MEEQENKILSDVAMVVNAESFFRRFELSLKEKQLWPFPISFSCCSQEFQALESLNSMESELDSSYIDESTYRYDLLVVGGSLTHKMAPFLKAIYDKMPKDRWVLSVGACASSGGPYWTQPVVQGLSQLFPVDVYIPGCPPSPESIVYGFEVIRERIKQRVSASSQKEWCIDV